VFVEATVFRSLSSRISSLWSRTVASRRSKLLPGKALERVSAFYISDQTAARGKEDLQQLWHKLRLKKPLAAAPVFPLRS